MNDFIEQYKVILKSKLSPKRYEHSLCVADEAKRLAEKYGADTDKCYLAGLLHDITKDYSRVEHLKIFKAFDIILNVVETNSEKLWHAISGSAYLKYVLAINDDEIIDAVRYHTTAKSDMSLTSKILYLADFTSSDRDYEDVDIMREKVEISIEEAMLYALKFSITDLVERNKAVHQDTVLAFNQIVSN